MQNCKDILELLSGALTPIIAIIATYIAYQQFRIQRRQFRHDLYERRLSVYRAFSDFLWIIIRDAKIDYPQIGKYGTDTAEAVFLFDQEVNDYLELVRRKAYDLRRLGNKLYPENGRQGLPIGDERKKASEDECVLMTWFGDQLRESERLFKRKMGLEQ